MHSEEHSKGEFIYVFWWKRWGCPRGSDTGKIFHIKTILKGTLWHWKHKANNVGSWSKLRNQDNLPRQREEAHSTSYHKKRATLDKLFTMKENILILNVSNVFFFPNVLNYTVLYIHFPFFFQSSWAFPWVFKLSDPALLRTCESPRNQNGAVLPQPLRRGFAALVGWGGVILCGLQDVWNHVEPLISVCGQSYTCFFGNRLVF